MNRAWMISQLLLEKNIVGDNKTDARKDIQKAIVYLGTGQKVPKDLEERILKRKTLVKQKRHFIKMNPNWNKRVFY